MFVFLCFTVVHVFIKVADILTLVTRVLKDNYGNYIQVPSLITSQKECLFWKHGHKSKAIFIFPFVFLYIFTLYYLKKHGYTLPLQKAFKMFLCTLVKWNVIKEQGANFSLALWLKWEIQSYKHAIAVIMSSSVFFGCLMKFLMWNTITCTWHKQLDQARGFMVGRISIAAHLNSAQLELNLTFK